MTGTISTGGLLRHDETDALVSVISFTKILIGGIEIDACYCITLESGDPAPFDDDTFVCTTEDLMRFYSNEYEEDDDEVNEVRSSIKHIKSLLSESSSEESKFAEKLFSLILGR